MQKLNGILRLALGSIFLGCWAGSAKSDEIRFLPERSYMVFSVDLAGLLKSQTFLDLKKQIPVMEKAFESHALGYPIRAANVARITQGLAYKNEDVGVLTTLKPITAAEIKAGKIPPRFFKNYTHEEIKVGAFTVYEENFQFQFDEKDKPGPVEKGESFCVIEGKTVLIGRFPNLKKVLERNKNPELSAGMKVGLEQVGFASTLTLLIDPQGFPDGDKNWMKKVVPVEGFAAVFEKVDVLAIQGNVGEKINVRAMAICKDAASAAEVKKVAEAGVVFLKTLLKDDPRHSPRIKELMKEVRGLLDGLQLSSKGTQVRADLAAESTPVIKAIQLMIELEQRPKNAPNGK